MKRIFFLLLIFSPFQNIFAQADSTTRISLTYDTSLFIPHFQLDDSAFFSSLLISYSDTIIHYPDAEDSLYIQEHTKLINADPGDENFQEYFDLACALWKVSRNQEAEQIFLKIVNSKNTHYTQSKTHSSDIPGDASSNSYGYGSFTYDYKSEACVYLTKIYIERKQYKLALKYLDYSQKKYPMSYSCGTGHNLYMSEINSLYGMTYKALGMDNKIIKRFMPDCFHYDDILSAALRKKYSQKRIAKELTKAEKECDVREYPAYYDGKEIVVEHPRTEVMATTKLFGQTIYLPSPQPGEPANRDTIITNFRKTQFYQALTE